MRNKRAASFAVWLILLVAFIAVSFWNSSIYGISCAVIWCMLSIVSICLNLYNRKHLSVKIVLPATASKNEVAEGKLVVKYNGIFPVNMYCCIKLTNRLTGEETYQWLTLSAVRGSGWKESFSVSSPYCGYIVAEIYQTLLLDWFGFLTIKADIHGVGKISVLPDTFPMSVSAEVSMAQATDSDMWSEYKKGEDYSEVFALREYVPGDSIRQIHWKLSSKISRPVVREASYPIEKSLLLFWDKNMQATAGMMDVMAEIVSTVARELAGQGVQYSLGWTAGKTVVLEEVDCEETLIQLIPGMLKTGAMPEAGSGADIYSKMKTGATFGKVIYFAPGLSEDFTSLCQGEMTLVLGSVPDTAELYRTVVFAEDTYMEDLQAVEL